jgi:hypothetical protein
MFPVRTLLGETVTASWDYNLFCQPFIANTLIDYGVYVINLGKLFIPSISP